MKLNFGCGKKILKGWVNVDIVKGGGVSPVFNFNKFPYPIKDNSFNYILADNVMEHLDNPKEAVKELWRVSKDKGIINIIVPYCFSKWAYADLSHKHFFNESSARDLFIEKDYKKEKDIKFKIIKLEMYPSSPLQTLPKFFLKILNRYFLNIYCRINIMAMVVK